jgi:hypothetical protein
MTVKEYLETLPEPERSRALRNMDFEKQNDQATGLEHAVWWAFKWHRSPEGYKYWHQIHAGIVGNYLNPPYVYSVFFKNMDTETIHREDFCCNTENLPFAAIIFISKKLPERVRIIDMAINGYQSEFYSYRLSL